MFLRITEKQFEGLNILVEAGLMAYAETQPDEETRMHRMVSALSQIELILNEIKTYQSSIYREYKDE